MSGVAVRARGAVARQWQRQAILAALGCAVLVLTGGLLALAAAYTGGPRAHLSVGATGGVEVIRPGGATYRLILAIAVIDLIATTALLGAVLLHIGRLAAFTFRLGDDH